jgi:hypothetical protein
MSSPFNRQIRSVVLAGLILTVLVAGSLKEASAGPIVPLAQATPEPVTLPSNVQRPTRMYITEGIVIVLLFGGAIFGVCRSSGRS